LRAFAKESCIPSVLIEYCVKKGGVYSDGGARYNTNYMQSVEIRTITDILVAIRHHVFKRETVSMSDLLQLPIANFDCFCDLGKTLQDEIIARTEHQGF
jgi:formate C-acetyltransferase